MATDRLNRVFGPLPPGLAALAAAVLGLPFAGTAAAAEFEAYGELQTTYTDNVTLAGRGAEEADLVLEVNPGFSLRTTNDGSVVGGIDYRMQNLFYARDSGRNQTFHQMGGTGGFELVPQRFRIDTNARYAQTISDPSRPIPLSNVADTDNLVDFWSLYATPEWRQPIAGDTTIVLSHQAGVVEYDIDPTAANNIDDFTSNWTRFRIGNDDLAEGFQWTVDYEDRRYDYENFRPFRYERAGLDVLIPLRQRVALLLSGGVETDVLVDQSAGGLDADYWLAGFAFGLNQGGRFEIRTGERYFGRTYLLFWEQNVRRFTANVTYSEDPTTISFEQMVLTQGLPGGAPEGPGRDIRPLTADVYLNKYLSARLAWIGNNNRITLTGTNTDREYQAAENDEDGEKDVILEWEHDIGTRTRLVTQAYFARLRFRNTQVEDDLTQYVLGLYRDVGASTVASLRLRYEQRKSDGVDAAFDYVENAVIAAVVRRF